LNPTEKIRRRHTARLLGELEQNGNITEADKSLVKFHIKNMVNDLVVEVIKQVEGDPDESRFNR
jgi:hypothetical protein